MNTKYKRTILGAVSGPILAAGLFAGVATGAGVSTSAAADDGTTHLPAVQLVDWQEECNNEGCSTHEVEELYESFKSECYQEGCYTEEVFELSGGPRYHYNPMTEASRIPELFEAFNDRLGVTVEYSDWTHGSTPGFGSFWNRIRQWLLDNIGDEIIIETPGIDF